MSEYVNNGWVKLWRELLSKGLWTASTPEQCKILITILLMVNHEASEWEWKGSRYSCKAGQMITSTESIAVACGKGISRQNVRTALKRFEKFGFLTIESTNQSTLITVVNWEKYQGFSSDLTNELTNDQPTTNQRLTNDQPTTNQRLTTNNKYNNNKNNKNDEEGKENYARVREDSSSVQEVSDRYQPDEEDMDELHEKGFTDEQIDAMSNDEILEALGFE